MQPTALHPSTTISSLPLAFDSIVEDLANQGWSVCDDFLSADWCRQLQDEHRQLALNGGFSPAGIGNRSGFQHAPGIRNDRISWLDPASCAPAQRQYLDLLEQFRLTVNRCLMLGLYSLEVHAAAFPEGSYYHRHLDCFRQHNNRVLTVILYLNPGWNAQHGGELRLYLDPDGRHQDIQPLNGRLVTFLSDRFPHEVRPAKRERHSLTGWFSRRPAH